jgi:membrane-bound serine protease (ClpP class)
MDGRRSVPRRRGLVLLAGAIAILGAGAVHAGAASPGPAVVELKLEGVVDPFVASYVSDGISQAEANGAPAVLLTIDTPGGLDSSMRQIIQAILASRVPVICYTAPSGARAASAGTFIMMGCPVSAMAPGTNIGAAHPVGVSGAIEVTKVTNDAAAFIRSLADRWGRNATWAEDAVRNSVSITAEDALREHVVDLVAPSTSALLDVAGGCGSGTPPAPPTTGLLASRASLPGLCGASISPRSMGLGAGLLHALIEPDLAFLFFYLGLALIIVELLHPGASVPGVAGTLMLITAFISFGLLPVRLVGILLLLASAVSFLFELKHPGLGLPTIGGVSFLVFGALLLFSSSVPNARVSLWLIALVAGGLVVFFGFVVRGVMAARRMPRTDAPIPRLVGATGTTLEELAPRGRVRVERENWSAESSGAPIPAGAPVRVVEVQGLLLVVSPAAEHETAAAGAAGQERGGSE